MSDTNPLDAACPACLAAPGEDCYATSSDQPRRAPHRLRGLAAHQRLIQCDHCHGVGWRPDDKPETDTRDRTINIQTSDDPAHGDHLIDLMQAIRAVRALEADVEHWKGRALTVEDRIDGQAWQDLETKLARLEAGVHHLAAEAHRRKWKHQDTNPEACDELHRIGTELAVLIGGPDD